jgi:hypothetical protein
MNEQIFQGNVETLKLMLSPESKDFLSQDLT